MKKQKNKLKIAMISPYFTESVGGAQISTKIFVEEITKMKNNVVVISNKLKSNKLKSNKFNSKNKREKFAYEIRKIEFFNFLNPSWRAFLLNTNIFDFYLSLKLLRLFKKIKPDIVHVQELLILPASIKAAKKLKLSVMATIRDDRFICNLAICKRKGDIFLKCSNRKYLNCLKKTSKEIFNIEFPAYILLPFLKPRPKRLLNCLGECNKIISVSNYIKEILIKVGVNRKKVQAVYNLMPDWKINKEDVRKLKKKYGKEKFIIFSSGRLVDYKGFHILVSAMPEIIKNKKNIILLIAGDGPLKNELIRLINKHDLNNNVKLIGKIDYDKIKNYYAMCDIVVAPSIWQEPISRIIWESFILKKPLITTNTGGTKEYVKNLSTGILVNDFKPSTFAKEILKLEKNNKLRLKLGKKGFNLLKNHNNIQINKYIAIYKKICKGQNI